jgi:hypothetical protein
MKHASRRTGEGKRNNRTPRRTTTIRQMPQGRGIRALNRLLKQLAMRVGRWAFPSKLPMLWGTECRVNEWGKLHARIACQQQSWNDKQAGDQLDTRARDERHVHGISPPGYTQCSKSHGLAISPYARGLWGELVVTLPPYGPCSTN